MKVVGADLDRAYSDNIVDSPFQLGARYEDAVGREYVYARYQDLGGGDGAAGLWAVGCDTAYEYWDLTADSDHADANDGDPGGQMQYALSDGECGFFQVSGPSRQTTTTGGSVTQDSQLVVSGSTRGILENKASHKKSCGVARVDDTSTSIAAGGVSISVARR